SPAPALGVLRSREVPHLQDVPYLVVAQPLDVLAKAAQVVAVWHRAERWVLRRRLLPGVLPSRRRGQAIEGIVDVRAATSAQGSGQVRIPVGRVALLRDVAGGIIRIAEVLQLRAV